MAALPRRPEGVVSVVGLTLGEERRLKRLGALLRKAQREERIVDQVRIEREITSIRHAAGLTD
jgi:hypothetical protein